MKYLILLLSLSANALPAGDFLKRLDSAQAANNFPLFSLQGEPCSLEYTNFGVFLDLKIVRPHHSIHDVVHLPDELTLQDGKVVLQNESLKGARSLAWTFTFAENELSSIEAKLWQCVRDNGRTCIESKLIGRPYSCTTTPFGP